MIVLNETGLLTDEQIREWASKAQEMYDNALKGKSKSSPRVRLGIEETLLRFRDKFGNQEECRIECRMNRDMLRIVVSMHGSQINPLNMDDEQLTIDILEKLNLRPRYTYKVRRRLNVVTETVMLPPRKNALLMRLGFSVVLAIVTKLILNMLPGEVGTAYVIPLLAELFKKVTMLFSATATPLIFLAVINGIGGLGDVAFFGKIGKRLLLRMLFTYCLAMVIMVALGAVMGLATLHSTSSGGNVLQDLSKLVLDMIPNNMLDPFLQDNDLQVIMLSIFIGVIMLGLGEKVAAVRNFLSQLSELVSGMMLAVCKLLPLFVYLGVFDLIQSDRLKDVYKVSQILIISLVGSAVLITITILRTLYMTKIPPKKLFSAHLPSLIINLTTSSQVSAYPESVKCCRDQFGIEEKVVNFGLPLGVVIYMPNGAIMLGALTWVLAVMTNGPLDPGMLLKLAFVAMVVAIAAPPIPGSAFAVMPIMFSACGTDLSLMPLAVIVASTVGYLLPAMNGFCLQEELLMSAWKSGMVDKAKALEMKQ
jgi:Na+/H+-dicarboxylate symporters